MTDEIIIEGKVSAGFEKVREVFKDNLESGKDIGASFAVFKDNEPLVDIWGGYADRNKTKPWEKDTLVNVYSTTKGLAALCCAILVERGKLDYDAKVTEYWPEFGAHGKENLTVAQLLSHQAGLCAPRQAVKAEDFYVKGKINALLLDQEPLFEPGSASGYHSMTFGPLVGELVERVAGKSLGTFLREEVGDKFDIDFYIGLPESEDHRVAELVAKIKMDRTMGGTIELSEVQRLTFSNPLFSPEIPNTREWRAAEIASANGQGNARSIAKAYSIWANGGVFKGERVFSEDTIGQALKTRIEGRDLVIVLPMQWGAGYIKNNFKLLYGPNVEAFGHSGFGGSFGHADPVAGISVGYAMNKMELNLAGDPRTLKLVKAVYDSVKAL